MKSRLLISSARGSEDSLAGSTTKPAQRRITSYGNDKNEKKAKEITKSTGAASLIVANSEQCVWPELSRSKKYFRLYAILFLLFGRRNGMNSDPDPGCLPAGPVEPRREGQLDAECQRFSVVGGTAAPQDFGSD
jgi:hypothetical protein